MALLALRGVLPDHAGGAVDTRWMYAVQAAAAGALLAWWWRDYGELSAQTRPTGAETLGAVAVGLAVFGLWIVLDAPWMTIGTPSAAFVPVDADGRVDPLLVGCRLAGAALVVPVMEELFWRSFLMRWIERPVFEGVDPRRVGLKAIVLSTFVFMLAHTQWLAAIVAGLAYALLYRRTGKLWVPVIAHAVTNGILGVWVLATGAWQFW